MCPEFCTTMKSRTIEKANNLKWGYMLVFSDKKYYVYFSLSALTIFSIFVGLPVLITPGNDIKFQLTELMKPLDYVLLITLSILTAYLITMHIYDYKQKALLRKRTGIIGIITAIFSGILASFGCVACFLSTVAFLPVAGVVFLSQYKTYISLFAIAFLLITIYYMSLKIAGLCETCK